VDYQDLFRLDGKLALVTGASSGIGAATARMLAQAGASVLVGYNRGSDRADSVVAELPGAGHRTVHISLEDSQTARDAARMMEQDFGRLDILVNSAGFTRPVAHNDLEGLDDALFEAILIANVRGPFSIIRAFAPLLRASGNGVVANVSSISGFTGSGSSIAYCAAKAALDTMTISLARVLAPEVRINCISPAAVATDFVAGRDRGKLEALAQTTPLRCVVEPEQVAAAILATITHLGVTTGTRIVMDGGRHL